MPTHPPTRPAPSLPGSLIGALGFWPATVLFPVEMYRKIHKPGRWGVLADVAAHMQLCQLVAAHLGGLGIAARALSAPPPRPGLKVFIIQADNILNFLCACRAMTIWLETINVFCALITICAIIGSVQASPARPAALPALLLRECPPMLCSRRFAPRCPRRVCKRPMGKPAAPPAPPPPHPTPAFRVRSLSNRRAAFTRPPLPPPGPAAHHHGCQFL